MDEDVLKRVREAAAMRILFLPHAIRQMSRPERMISAREVEGILRIGEVIEDYPEDARGHSCLLLGRGESGRPIHVVCGPRQDYVAVISAYLPDPTRWSDDFRSRRD